jgi:Flp pilus assembly protein TadB
MVPAPFSLQDLRKQAEKELAEAEEAQQKAAEAAARAGEEWRSPDLQRLEEQLQQAQKARCTQNGREMSRVAMEIEQNGVLLLFWVCLSKKIQKVSNSYVSASNMHHVNLPNSVR